MKTLGIEAGRPTAKTLAILCEFRRFLEGKICYTENHNYHTISGAEQLPRAEAIVSLVCLLPINR